MAESQLSVLLTLKDAATEGLKKFNNTIKDNQKLLLDASKYMMGFGGALTAAFGLSAKAAFEEQANIGRLSIMLKNVGVEYDNVKDSLEGVITATQYKTGVADDKQRDVMGRLLLVTNDYNKALSLLPLTLDLAAAGGMDATTAATYLGKALEELAGGAEKVTVRLGQASMQFSSLEELEERVAGAAEAMANPLDILKASFGDLVESIGGTLVPVIKGLIDKILPLIQMLQKWAEANPWLVQTIAALGAVILGAGGLLFAVIQLQKVLTTLGGLYTSLIAKTVAQTGANTALNKSFLSVMGGMKGTIGAAAGLAAGLAMIGFGVMKLTDLNAKYNAYIQAHNALAEEMIKYNKGEANSYAETATAYADAYQAYVDASGMRKEEKEERYKYIESIRDTVTAVNEQNKVVEKSIQLTQEQKNAIKDAYKEAQNMINVWWHQHSAAGYMQVDMQDIYNYLLDIGTEAQNVADAFVRYGNDTKYLDYLLSDFGITLEQVGWAYGNLAEEAEKAAKAEAKALDEMRQKVEVYVAAMNNAREVHNAWVNEVMSASASSFTSGGAMSPLFLQGIAGITAADIQNLMSLDPMVMYRAMLAIEGYLQTGEGTLSDALSGGGLQGIIDEAEKAQGYAGSYASGGTVPGPIGQPVPIIAHGGERFLGAGNNGGDNYYITVQGSILTEKEFGAIVRKQILYTKDRNFSAGLS